MKIKVKQMTSHTSGRPIANQFIIETAKGRYFQSYDSIIAFKPYFGKTELDEHYWDYSRTTGRYRNMFLNEYIDETREKIKLNKYKLTNLN